MLTRIHIPIVALCLLLTGLTLWRWHEHAVAAPVLLEGEAGEFLLVANERDCAESARWLVHWVAPLLDRGLQVRAVLVRSGALAPDVATLGSGIALAQSRASSDRPFLRVLSRAGVKQTPALILLGEGGRPIAVEPLFDGTEASIAPVVRTLIDVHENRLLHATASRITP